MIPEAKTYAEVFVCVRPTELGNQEPFIVLGRSMVAQFVCKGYGVYQLHNAMKVERVDTLINDELQRMVKDGK